MDLKGENMEYINGSTPAVRRMRDKLFREIHSPQKIGEDYLTHWKRVTNAQLKLAKLEASL